MPPSQPSCECKETDGPIFCDRHGIEKPPHWVHLCKTNPSYFEAWEEGRGPGQLVAESGRRKKKRYGPGTELARMLSWMGLGYTKTCRCKNRARKMDQWGPDGCTEHLDTILGWLEEEAERRNLPFIRLAAKVMVKSAITRSRRKLAKDDQDGY